MVIYSHKVHGNTLWKRFHVKIAQKRKGNIFSEVQEQKK